MTWHSETYRRIAREKGTLDNYCSVRHYNSCVLMGGISGKFIKHCMPCRSCRTLFLCHGSKISGHGGMGLKPDDRLAYLGGDNINRAPDEARNAEAKLAELTHAELSQYLSEQMKAKLNEPI